jgi:hypothetical protein
LPCAFDEDAYVTSLSGAQQLGKQRLVEKFAINLHQHIAASERRGGEHDCIGWFDNVAGGQAVNDPGFQTEASKDVRRRRWGRISARCCLSAARFYGLGIPDICRRLLDLTSAYFSRGRLLRGVQQQASAKKKREHRKRHEHCWMLP